MRSPKYMQNVLIGATAVLFAGANFIPGHHQKQGPVMDAAVALATGKAVSADPNATAKTASLASSAMGVAGSVRSALEALSSAVRPLSRPRALTDAFRSYFAYKTEHPEDVKKPYLYFVDYGLPSTEPRGYVFDMESLKIVEGPFTVAHGRGSSTSQYGVPTKFSNRSGSEATSLGLYLTKSTYDFHGKTGGHPYSSIALRLDGVSTGFNDNAFARGVVAHGAPYVTSSKAGRSEGCPAVEPSRAKELLPKLANGAMVFLYAPDQNWETRDPWLAASADVVDALNDVSAE